MIPTYLRYEGHQLLQFTFFRYNGEELRSLTCLYRAAAVVHLLAGAEVTQTTTTALCSLLLYAICHASL